MNIEFWFVPVCLLDFFNVIITRYSCMYNKLKQQHGIHTYTHTRARGHEMLHFQRYLCTHSVVKIIVVFLFVYAYINDTSQLSVGLSFRLQYKHSYTHTHFNCLYCISFCDTKHKISHCDLCSFVLLFSPFKCQINQTSWLLLQVFFLLSTHI